MNKNSKRSNEKTGLESIVRDTINKFNLIEDGDKIVVGVSGGPDSICLLNVLKNLKCPKQTRNGWARNGWACRCTY